MKWLWNVAKGIVNKLAKLKHAKLTAAADGVKNRSATPMEKYVKWLWNVAKGIVNKLAKLKHAK